MMKAFFESFESLADQRFLEELPFFRQPHFQIPFSFAILHLLPISSASKTQKGLKSKFVNLIDVHSLLFKGSLQAFNSAKT